MTLFGKQVCSRGGDLSMLEILTESEDTLEGRNRVTNILEEQRKTLKFAMSRPQVVLYETHSELDVENSDMVRTTLNEINRLAKLHHASIQGLLGTNNVYGIQMPSEMQKEINNNENNFKESEKIHRKSHESGDNFNRDGSSVMVDIPDCSPDELKKVVVPDTDLFDNLELPCLCPEEMNCKMENGCYLALLQRKQVLRLDNKYMIQMAEQRGLFGSTNTSSKQKSNKQSRKKEQIVKQEIKPKRLKKKLKDIEVDRIAAPTHSFLRHVDISCHECQRCKQAEEEIKSPNQRSYKKWWTETTHYLSTIKSSLIRKNILPPKRTAPIISSKNIVNELVHATCRIDELVAKHNSANTFPVVPKLKLPRERIKGKVPLVIPITFVSFPQNYCTNHVPNFCQNPS